MTKPYRLNRGDAMAVTIDAGFTEAERPQVARLYWQAFGAKLGKVLGPDRRALAFLEQALTPEFALVARRDGALLGVAGFQTPQGLQRAHLLHAPALGSPIATVLFGPLCIHIPASGAINSARGEF